VRKKANLSVDCENKTGKAARKSTGGFSIDCEDITSKKVSHSAGRFSIDREVIISKRHSAGRLSVVDREVIETFSM
jgi:hypothetical protein